MPSSFTAYSMTDSVRRETNTVFALALGNDKFRQEIEMLTGRRVTGLKRGLKVKNKLFFTDLKYS